MFESHEPGLQLDISLKNTDFFLIWHSSWLSRLFVSVRARSVYGLTLGSSSAGFQRARYRTPTDHHHWWFCFWEVWSDQGQGPNHQLPHCSHPGRHSAGGADRTRTVFLFISFHIKGIFNWSYLSVVTTSQKVVGGGESLTAVTWCRIEWKKFWIQISNLFMPFQLVAHHVFKA